MKNKLVKQAIEKHDEESAGTLDGKDEEGEAAFSKEDLENALRKVSRLVGRETPA